MNSRSDRSLLAKLLVLRSPTGIDQKSVIQDEFFYLGVLTQIDVTVNFGAS